MGKPVAITGTNFYPAKKHLHKLTHEFTKVHGDIALEKIDAQEVETNQIHGAIESLPFLADKKMVVLHNLSANKEAAEQLEQLIEKAGDTTELIIVESKLDKRSVYYKQLKKLTDFNEYEELQENDLAGWLVQQAKEQSSEISRGDAQYLIQRVGAFQQKLSNELYKLSQYDPKITRKTIDLLTDENPSSTIFNLVDSVFSGNAAQALKIYEDQRRQRVEPQAIHGMLVWQMHAVSIASAAPKGKTSADIAKDSGMSPFVVQKSQRIAQKMGRAKILEFMKLLRDIDYKSKRQPLDYDDALKYAIISLGK